MAESKPSLQQKEGMAWADFRALAHLWKHTSINRSRKIQILQATITSRLLNGLSSAWLNEAGRRRLDGFQSRCLREILGIRPAYVSRIPNSVVLKEAYQKQYSQQLLIQQLKLFGNIARAPDNDPLRTLTFCPGSLLPANSEHIRKVRIPRNEWPKQLYDIAFRMVGGDTKTMNLLMVEPSCWNLAVKKYFE